MYDLYHSIGRVAKRHKAEVPCVLPSSRMYLLRPGGGRLLTPPELLAVQGFDLQTTAHLPLRQGVASKGPNASRAGFSWGEASRLAGNAFSAFPFAGVAAAALLLLAEACQG